MSTPGPTIIHECTSCGSHVAEETQASGNSCGAKYWTDGRREAPMDPDQDWLVICPHCHSLVWIDEGTQIGMTDHPRFNSSTYPDAQPALSPEHQDYLRYSKECGSLDYEKERYVRLRAWWLSNDVRRTTSQKVPLSSDEIENLRAYIRLLDFSDPVDRISKAEALRELGEYDEAVHMLSTKYPPGLQPVVNTIRHLAKKNISEVSEVHFS